MSFMMLCVFGMVAGCGQQPEPPLTAEQVQALKVQNAVTVETNGYQSVILEKQCIDGVSYYAGRAGHAMYLAPVVDKTTLLFTPCGLP